MSMDVVLRKYLSRFEPRDLCALIHVHVEWRVLQDHKFN